MHLFLRTPAQLQKSPLASLCLSAHLFVSPYVSVQLQLDRFLWNLILEAFKKICQGTQNLVTSRHNIGHLTWRPKYILFFLATATCSSTIHTECNVVFPSQLWLHKHTTMVHYVYTVYLIFLQWCVVFLISHLPPFTFLQISTVSQGSFLSSGMWRHKVL
jgi:hypothetical protein